MDKNGKEAGRKKKMERIVLLGFCTLFAVIWFVIGKTKYDKWAYRYRNCTQELPVRVVEVLERRPMRGSSMLYKPIFQPEEGDDRTLIDTAYYSNLLSFQVGERVVLLVNPANIKEFRFKEEQYNKGMKADLVACVIPPLVFLALVLIYVRKH